MSNWTRALCTCTCFPLPSMTIIHLYTYAGQTYTPPRRVVLSITQFSTQGGEREKGGGGHAQNDCSPAGKQKWRSCSPDRGHHGVPTPKIRPKRTGLPALPILEPGGVDRTERRSGEDGKVWKKGGRQKRRIDNHGGKWLSFFTQTLSIIIE